jgi:hypothetical protein
VDGVSLAALLEFLKAQGAPKCELSQRADLRQRKRHCTVVSVEDHVVDPPDLFDGGMRAPFAELAPHRDGADGWTFEGEQIALLGAHAVQSCEPARRRGPGASLRRASASEGEI